METSVETAVVLAEGAYDVLAVRHWLIHELGIQPGKGRQHWNRDIPSIRMFSEGHN